MPRHRSVEKSKDFVGTLKRLLKNLRAWKYLMIVSLILAMISSILSLIAPNKLSDFADEISIGLIPRTEVLESIGTEISDNFKNIDFQNKYKEIMVNDSITGEDKLALTNTMKNISSLNDEEKMVAILSLPKSILENLLTSIKYEDTTISVGDQLETINILGDIKDKENVLIQLDKLPKSVFELVKPKLNTDKIKNIAIFMGVLYLVSSLFSYVQGLSMTIITNKFAKKLRSSVSDKINRLPLKYFDCHETGDILSRITNDIDTIAQNLNNSLSSLVSSSTLFIGSIIMMFITNWIMAITAIVTSLIGFSFMGGILKKSQKYFIENQRSLGELNGYIEEIYSGHNVVKSYNAVDSSRCEFERLNKNLYEAKRKSIFLSGTMQPLMGFIGNLGYVAVCIVGALLTMNNVISFGVIVAFMVYVRLFTNPLSQIAQSMTNLQSTAAASERVFEFLDEEEMTDESNITDSINKEKVKGNIEFKNVKFGYDKDKIIINDFSAKASSGQKIAIVGPTGAGKTTMVNLLMKFYEINDGDIIIDGISTKKLTRDNIHKLFIMVLQDTWLFEGTIRDNIKFNKENVTDEEIWNALRTVGVDHFVKTLPGGLDYVLTESDSISQGQKQLLTIARGMIEDAPFLILDEATSNVDTRTEELVQKAMDKLTKGHTSFIIAHRLSTIKNADLILVMDHGNIIEMGNHDELMKQKGFYCDLYNSQFTK